MPRPKTFGAYHKISHAQRLQVIYLRVVHDLPLKEIQELSGVKYNTIRNILHIYRKQGRTNKKFFCKKEPAAHPASMPHEHPGPETPSSATNAEQKNEQSPDKPKEAFASRRNPEGLIKCEGPAAKNQMCSLRLVLEGDTLPGVTSAPSNSDALSLRLKDEFEEAPGPSFLEMASSDMHNFENMKESRLQLFTGSLRFMNSLVRWGDQPSLLHLSLAEKQRAADFWKPRTESV